MADKIKLIKICELPHQFSMHLVSYSKDPPTLSTCGSANELNKSRRDDREEADHQPYDPNGQKIKPLDTGSISFTS